MAAIERERIERSLAPYKCRCCGKWHLGNDDDRAKLGMKDNDAAAD
jgi:hypothetical protein